MKITPLLPQNDPNIAQRNLQLEKTRNEYQYDYNYLPPMAITSGLPDEEKFSTKYKLGFLSIFEKMLANQLYVGAKYFKQDYNHIHMSGIPHLFKKVIDEGATEFAKNMMYDLFEGEVVRANNMDEFFDIFHDLPKPEIAKFYNEDKEFAYQRVAGYNPTFIKQIKDIPSNFPVTDVMFQVVAKGETTLEAAAQKGSLYLCDYAILDNIPTGKVHDIQKCLVAPLALFYANANNELMPVAIQLSQTPSSENPVFTPKDGIKWTIAKTYVQMAEGNHHETIAHLSCCHFVMEPIIVAAMRELAVNHPLHILLKPHFRFTIAINDNARNGLLVEGGVVDTLLSSSIKGSFELVKRAIEKWRFDEVGPVATFKNRNVYEKSDLTKFPFRDDTMLLWDAIYKFVADYLAVYYGCDENVAADKELQGWFKCMVAEDGGRIKGMTIDKDGGISSLEYLTQVVSQIIYIAGPQHASVNFAQLPFMSYAPNCPLALFDVPPTATSEEDEETYRNRLPPIDSALYQQQTAYKLSAMQYDTLGIYPAETFEDPRVKGIIKQFEKDLKSAEEEIKQRNKKRERPYLLQLPSAVPNSISI